eukprot:TRINITY_DN5200_c0_g1_i2.p1 TRINITY_DN5200_c0_g1~~TRINITY_DN5200_c0_g1_i2.p1  ORF type:complete len:528 (+),score=140.54 TRINITY_DN5200_c0_g1_i2:2111-3694(+)
MSVVVVLPTQEQVAVDLELNWTVRNLVEEVKDICKLETFDLVLRGEVISQVMDKRLQDLGIADGDVLQAVLDEKNEARMLLELEGLPNHRLCAQEFTDLIATGDRADLLDIYYKAGYLSYDAMTFSPLMLRSPHVLEYLLTFKDNTKYVRHVARGALLVCLWAKNLTVTKRLAELGATKMSNKVPSIVAVISHLSRDPALADFLDFYVPLPKPEDAVTKMYTVVKELARSEEPGHDAMVLRLIERNKRLSCAAFLVAVFNGRYNWADAMLKHCTTATFVRCDQLPVDMTDEQLSYIERLLDVMKPSVGHTRLYVAKLLKRELRPSMVKLVKRLLATVTDYPYLAKTVHSLSNLELILDEPGCKVRRRETILEAAKAFRNKSNPDLHAMWEKGLLNELTAEDIRVLVYNASASGSIKGVEFLVTPGIVSTNPEEDPMYGALKNNRSASTIALLQCSDLGYDKLVYSNGESVLDAAIELAHFIDGLAMTAILRTAYGDATPPSEVLTKLQRKKFTLFPADAPSYLRPAW